MDKIPPRGGWGKGDNMLDVIVVGAGIAGLQCARRLTAAGADLLVMDRADKPGGRCATRTFDGQPADYGALFLHGDDKGFLSAIDSVDGVRRIDGWPHTVRGRGAPCQPDAFAPFETRLAFAEGVNAFPRALAHGLPVQLHTLVTACTPAQGFMQVSDAQGTVLSCRHLVLALALEQSLPFLRAWRQQGSGEGALGMLEMFSSLPCLTVIAGYPASAPSTDWDVCYPEDDPALLLMSNESAKRPHSSSRIMVYQASARWSRQRMASDTEQWARELLEAAARRLGPWAASPLWTHPHRWKYSRVDRANELAAPLRFSVGQSRVGIIGDLFSPGGGLQAAWLAGDRLGAELFR
jgi:renalase